MEIRTRNYRMVDLISLFLRLAFHSFHWCPL
jgi:hypothetical protein